MRTTTFILISIILLSFDLPEIKDQNILPAKHLDGIQISRKYYMLEYSEHFRQARWVAYRVQRSSIPKNHINHKDVLKDPETEIDTRKYQSAYHDSGFKGAFLCEPSHVSKRDSKELNYFSNTSPQYTCFSEGLWSNLNKLIGIWAEENEEVYVITAGVLNDQLVRVSDGKIAVPDYFYKIVIAINGTNIKTIGFLLPQVNEYKSLKEYAVEIDKIEELTNINFFPGFSGEIEEKFEANINTSEWDFHEDIIDKRREFALK